MVRIYQNRTRSPVLQHSPLDDYRECICLIKNSIRKPSGKNSSWRKEYISTVIVLYMLPHQQLYVRNIQVKTHKRKKSTTFNLLCYIVLYTCYSSWIVIDLQDLCTNFQILATMIYMILNNWVANFQSKFNN